MEHLLLRLSHRAPDEPRLFALVVPRGGPACLADDHRDAGVGALIASNVCTVHSTARSSEMPFQSGCVQEHEVHLLAMAWLSGLFQKL